MPFGILLQLCPDLLRQKRFEKGRVWVGIDGRSSDHAACRSLTARDLVVALDLLMQLCRKVDPAQHCRYHTMLRHSHRVAVPAATQSKIQNKGSLPNQNALHESVDSTLSTPPCVRGARSRPKSRESVQQLIVTRHLYLDDQ